MDALLDFLEQMKERHYATGNFLGLLHVLIGRRLETSDGRLISNGVTWRNLAAVLKKARWEKEAIKDLKLDAEGLPPRDRERYWYAVIVQAKVDSAAAAAAGDRLAEVLRGVGYTISAAPGR